MPSSIQFWSNDISSLFNKDYIFELWPTPNMTFEQKLNAITRLIIILTILGFIVTLSIKILLIGVITMFVLYLMYNSRKSKATQETPVKLCCKQRQAHSFAFRTFEKVVITAPLPKTDSIVLKKLNGRPLN